MTAPMHDDGETGEKDESKLHTVGHNFFERWFTRLIFLICLVSFFILVIYSAYAIPVARETRDNVSIGRRTDEISACRAIIGSVTNIVRDERQQSDRIENNVRNDISIKEIQIIEALTIGDADDATILNLRNELNSLRERLQERQAIGAELAVMESEAVQDQQDAYNLSFNDPDKFLEDCNRRYEE